MHDEPQRSGKQTTHPWGEPSLRVTLLPRDTNLWGTIFGGVILSQIDLAGAVEARRISKHNIVTVAMREVIFHEPVHVGDLLSFYTRTERIGRTSITVKVSVWAQRAKDRTKVAHVTEACVTLVAVDEDLKPTPVMRRTRLG